MFPIASYYVSSGFGGDISLTNIPQTFTHLQLRVFARSTYTGGATSNYQGIYFNGAPTSNNYPTHILLGDGSSVSSSSNLTSNQIIPDSYSTPSGTATANVFSINIWDILDYTNTNKNKTVRVLSGFDANGSGRVSLGSGFWTSTSAITQIDVTTVNYFAAGSRFDLYGIQSSPTTGA